MKILKKKILKKKVSFLLFFIEIFPKFLKKINYLTYGNLFTYKEHYVQVKILKKYIFHTLKILKNHQHFVYNSITDIICIDYPFKTKRYQLNYLLLSYITNHRLCINLKLKEHDIISSITLLYQAAGWLERECWDMMGIFFKGHKDLRRILTDYGFENFPLRKDYPMFGYVELKYNDFLNKLTFVPTELAQEYRIFNFKSPWENTK